MTDFSSLTTPNNILIVDDSSINVGILTHILEKQGYQIKIAISGLLALQEVRTCPPDLILLDIILPDMNGYAVCKMLKADPKIQDIPIIFMSALEEVPDKVKAFEMGAVDYMTKPFEPVEMLARIETHLRLRSLQVKLQTQNHRLQKEICERAAAETALKRANHKLKRLANLDGLTQVANRRLFDGAIAKEWQRLQREQLPLALLLIDVDYFKSYNDHYGHLAGDDCLRQIARAIAQSAKRPADLVARYGGEEFAIILPNTKAEGAINVAQRLLEDVEGLNIPHVRSTASDRVTISIGVSITIPTQDQSPEDLIASADRALYQAKQQGRNRVIADCLRPAQLTQIAT
ncbi:MAG: PleD family two-component system response regulator [Jaaginema sp. PMC 1079.18]|nr:PleD family two-component system response regulator [Jaaginema sp. PMC 1080.18]MEC4851843.1 PleD family two-component system response regulator [Jaaginema sp. PMC 1079.18]MEC4864495.1 PleD family two-component system response regulator [Jaaginema sp. PMC 1078.18]